MKNKDIAKKVSATLTGRICSAGHCRKVSEANIGKILINNGIVAKRILADELATYENTEWFKGGLPRKKKGR